MLGYAPDGLNGTTQVADNWSRAELVSQLAPGDIIEAGGLRSVVIETDGDCVYVVQCNRDGHCGID